MILWMILFLIAGMILIISEFFLPGGVLGVLGVVLILISAALGIHGHPDQALFIIFAEIIGICLCLILGYFVITRTKASRLLTQEHSLNAADGDVSAESDTSLLDQRGIVLTALRPAGTINVGNKRVDAVSDGSFIEEGASVRVIEIHGSRVVVETIDNET